MRAKDPTRLRVLEVSYSRHVWGAELATMALAGPLAERGIDLTLAASPGGELEQRWRGLGLPFVPLAFPDRFGLRAADAQSRPSARQFAGELVSTARSVRMIARRARSFDVVHSNSLWAHLDCAMAGRLARRPSVIELHDLVRPGLGRTVLTTAAALSSSALAISQAVADCVGPRGAPHVLIVAPAVDLDRFGPGPVPSSVRRHLSSAERAPLVGIVGRIDPGKGVEVLVAAMGLLHGAAADAHLVVVGSAGLGPDSYYERVRAEAKRSLGDRVRFVGRVEDVAQTLRALDILVNASEAEPFGLSVLEAQAAAVAVIATRAGGIPDFVFDGDNGLLVPSGDADALAKAIERLVADGELRARLAERGRVTAQGRGIEARADVVAGVYRRAVRTSSAGAGGAP